MHHRECARTDEPEQKRVLLVDPLRGLEQVPLQRQGRVLLRVLGQGLARLLVRGQERWLLRDEGRVVLRVLERGLYRGKGLPE